MTNSSNSIEWPFADPKNLAVISTWSILRGGKPILLVSHDGDGWQFLDGGVPRMADAVIVSLQHIAQHDPSVTELADLPVGWTACRDDGSICTGITGFPGEATPLLLAH